MDFERLSVNIRDVCFARGVFAYIIADDCPLMPHSWGEIPVYSSARRMRRCLTCSASILFLVPSQRGDGPTVDLTLPNLATLVTLPKDNSNDTLPFLSSKHKCRIRRLIEELESATAIFFQIKPIEKLRFGPITARYHQKASRPKQRQNFRSVYVTWMLKTRRSRH